MAIKKTKKMKEVEEVLVEQAIEVGSPVVIEPWASLVAKYKAKGWDTNRIAARLMISKDKVESV